VTALVENLNGGGKHRQFHSFDMYYCGISLITDSRLTST